MADVFFNVSRNFSEKFIRLEITKWDDERAFVTDLNAFANLTVTTYTIHRSSYYAVDFAQYLAPRHHTHADAHSSPDQLMYLIEMLG